MLNLFSLLKILLQKVIVELGLVFKKNVYLFREALSSIMCY